MSIGIELLKRNDCASILPFASLEDLHFSNMTSCEEWHSIGMQVFPNLRQLERSRCTKLAGNLPSQPLSLETSQIVLCPVFSSCTPSYPKLQNLETNGSGNLVWQEEELPPSLCELVISRFQMLESMLEALSKNLHIQELSVYDCSNISLPLIHLPLSLKRLFIGRCEGVTFGSNSTASLQNLQSISILACNILKSMSDDMEGLLPILKKPSTNGCDEMEAFPEGILLPSLRELHMEYCEKRLSDHAEWRLPNITCLIRKARCLHFRRIKRHRMACSYLTSR